MWQKKKKVRLLKCAIIGTVGVPASYGGFETLAENLVRYHSAQETNAELTVYCSSKAFKERPKVFKSAKLLYINLNPNGFQSIPYDVLSILNALSKRTNTILLLGVSGAVALPIVRLFSKCKVITNIDGIEWKRAKWGRGARFVLRISEWLAVKFSHTVVADNQAIADHVLQSYGKQAQVIAYGGDHATAVQAQQDCSIALPSDYALALCRIEPENNIEMILQSFSRTPDNNLIFVGNWQKSEFGKSLFSRYSSFSNINLLNPIYEAPKLMWLRENAKYYVHGHSAGGTNPALVEMMHFGIPVFAFDCSFNRFSTEQCAEYFANSVELCSLLEKTQNQNLSQNGQKMKEIAFRRYTWKIVAQEYFKAIECK